MKVNNKIVISVCQGTSPSGNLTGRYYIASIEGWEGEGLTENEAVIDATQARAEAMIKINHNNRGFGNRLNLAGVA
jgi:hypothetical protein